MGAGEWCSGKVKDPRKLYEDTKETRVDIAMIPAYQNLWHNRGSGSTCLGGRFAHNEWPYISSISIAFCCFTRQITIDDKNMLLTVYDNEERQADSVYLLDQMLHHMLSRTSAAGVMFMFDVTKLSSWEATKELVKDAMELRESYSPPLSRSQFMIVGCKCDLVESREVEYQSVKEFADEHGLLCMDTSAKENFNVEYVFVSFAANLLGNSTVGRTAVEMQQA